MTTNRILIRLKRNSAGDAMVEFAITALVFLLLVFSILNFSMAAYAYNLVSYAAREGTRYASVRGSSATTPAGATDIEQFVKGESAGLNPSNLIVTTVWNPDNNPGSRFLAKFQRPAADHLDSR